MSDYPQRESLGMPTTGDHEDGVADPQPVADEDARQMDAFLRREKRLIEGICANGCGPMDAVPASLQEAAHLECPACGFGYFPVALRQREME